MTLGWRRIGRWGGGEIMNTQEVSSALVDRARIIRLNLYSGQGAFRRGGGRRGREGYLSFPSCTSSRTQIGTEGWAVSPGISILPFARLPPRETCQRTFIHADTRGPVLSLGTTERATRPSCAPPPGPRSWPATMACGLSSSAFSATGSFPACCRPRGAVDCVAPLTPRRPEEKVMKTAAAGWKIHAALPCIWVSPTHHRPLSVCSVSLSGWAVRMTHQSVRREVLLGLVAGEAVFCLSLPCQLGCPTCSKQTTVCHLFLKIIPKAIQWMTCNCLICIIVFMARHVAQKLPPSFLVWEHVYFCVRYFLLHYFCHFFLFCLLKLLLLALLHNSNKLVISYYFLKSTTHNILYFYFFWWTQNNICISSYSFVFGALTHIMCCFYLNIRYTGN